MGKKLTNEEVDRKLEGRKIKRLEDYVSKRVPIKFQCLENDCNFIWKTTTDSVLNKHTGCPKCGESLKLTNKEVDCRLENKQIKRLEEYINAHTYINFLCLNINCNHIWICLPMNILNKDSGCPQCNGGWKFNNEIIDLRLQNKNIKRIDDYVDARTKISFQCLNKNCNHIWPATPDSVARGGSGCPICEIPGKNERLIYKLLISNNIKFEHNYSISKINDNEKKKYRVDFYFPHSKLIIEYNGEQHYIPCKFGASISDEEAKNKLESQKNRDHYIERFCNNNNIKLIWIDSRIYKNKKLEQFIIDEILPKLN